MKTIALFRDASEAAFFQNLLEGEGIISSLIDGGATGIQGEAIRIEVGDENAPKAAELYRDYQKGGKERAQRVEATHPGKGFPFIGVWLFLTGVFFLLFAGYRVYRFASGFDRDELKDFVGIAGVVFTVFLFPFLVGFGITVKVYIITVIWRIVRRKPNQTPHPTPL